MSVLCAPNQKSRQDMLRKRVPLYAAAAGWVVVGVGSWLVMSSGLYGTPRTSEIKVAGSPACDYYTKRTKGYAHVSPLLSIEESCESGRMRKIKALVAGFLDEAAVGGSLTRASVYVDDLRSHEWFCLNPAEQFDAGSMLKVPTMMSILKLAESDEDLLAKRIRFDRIPALPAPSFPPSRSVQPGSEHSVLDLLEYTIIASDNVSNALLLQHMNTSRIEHLMVNIGLPKIDPRNRNYPLTALEYSAVLKALYNVAYLSPESSELAIGMLLRAEFSAGIRKGIPEHVEVAHKFGEWGPPGARQFHEAGIVYAGNGPYLIVVMTQGPEIKVLPEIVAGVSSIVYQQLAGTAANL